MDPILKDSLLGMPYAGAGTNQERVGLIGVVRNLIKSNQYTAKYIIEHCSNLGYNRKMVQDVFKELTGLDPKLIVNNNEYYNAPAYVPPMTLAWGYSKSKNDEAFYIVPWEYGYSVMHKNETEQPDVVKQLATIPEAVEELKKHAKKIQTLNKVITEDLLETETIQLNSNNDFSVNNPYFSDPIRKLKKSFKNKMITLSEFNKQARKMILANEITEEQANNLLAWRDEETRKQEIEDEFNNNEVLTHNQDWNQLEGSENSEEPIAEENYEANMEKAIDKAVGMLSDDVSFDDYAKATNKLHSEVFGELIDDIAAEWNVERTELADKVISALNKLNTKSKIYSSLSKKLFAFDEDEADDIQEEKTKEDIDKKVEELEDADINEALEELTPAQFFQDETQKEKANKISERVNKIIDKFNEKIKEISNYNVTISNYRVNIMNSDMPEKEGIIEDPEINAKAILQIILNLSSKGKPEEIKKGLVIFSIDDEKSYWSGTFKAENDRFFALNDTGLDDLFKDEDREEEIVEDII